MIVLGIDTSCDDTAVGIVENGRRVLSNVVSSQTKIHSRYKGVIPELASRQHLRNFIPVLDSALKKAALKLSLPGRLLDLSAIDLIAVTDKPGLPGGLLIGRVYAGALAYFSKKKLVETNHIHSHICAAYLTHRELKPPFFALVVSGGHTSMMDVAGYNNYKVVGETRDDAAGEAFDKVGNMLGLKYPGGIEIDKLVQSTKLKVKSGRVVARPWRAERNVPVVAQFIGQAGRQQINSPDKSGNYKSSRRPGRDKSLVFGRTNLFTRPYLRGTPDFSFSGIKTQAMYLIRELGKGGAVAAMAYSLREKEQGEVAAGFSLRETVATGFSLRERIENGPRTTGLSRDIIYKIAYEFSEAITDVLVGKTVEYAAKYGRKKIVVSGGVAANSMLRMKFLNAEAENKIRVYFPEKKYCTDNGAMVASCGYFVNTGSRRL